LVAGSLFPGETGSGKVVEKIKGEAENFEHELMIIDSSPGTGCPVIAAVRDANFVILLTEPTPSGFADLKRVLEVVNYFKLPWGVVLNKWDINKEISGKIEKFAKGKLLGKISYDKEIFRAVSNLTPIMETNLKAKKKLKKFMSRPLKPRKVIFDPRASYFKPRAVPLSELKEVELTPAELEASRLCDFKEMEQEKAAKKMGVSQSTLGRILASARKKTAEALNEGKAIKIK